jgi:hypothetical protein
MADYLDYKPNPVALVAGLGIGVLWLLMAAVCLWSALHGARDNRSDWALAWGLVGTLLAAGGGAAIIGTLYHQFRVKAQHAPGAHH